MGKVLLVQTRNLTYNSHENFVLSYCKKIFHEKTPLVRWTVYNSYAIQQVSKKLCKIILSYKSKNNISQESNFWQ